ncbi:mannose-1-phosphate guanylyltransferase/mannose-6-phosphate isomerase [Alteromonas sp. LMIT006]|uniref:mannose-1-phosphate guanylyltransferase/mannose-6-phosphate isomerase n=1 Tax=Alteromonadaceae TaxID=72275 RepID=UPI0020CA56EF|nr:mannose-1-phosphate guanylyltransferase/mannose-6-phosphate isomerase [Alteromonas sp. LMIT006]UTP72367.1 mannose-1-phosphate guanylyltransferase/mannose-6-phosphate isomerase [Alteromonas sp. LMIT006]
MIPVILAGGSGSRLWPKSRVAYPKQFLKLTSEQSMLQDTLTRLPVSGTSAPLLICNEEHRFLVAEQLRQINHRHQGIILEPVGRNTAPAIALAALQSVQNAHDPMLLVLAADHLIQDEEAFHQALVKARTLAEQNYLVTFGVVPEAPHTGYGYIKSGSSVSHKETLLGYQVAQFVEKPNLATAQDYVQSGDYYWNSGMFMFKARAYLAALKIHSPEILLACERALEGAEQDLDFIRVADEAFSVSQDDSIDYAVMEKAENVAMVPLQAGWSDVGAWSSLWDVAEKDSSGNAFVGDVLATQSHNNYVNAEGRLVTLVGCDDMVVVETKDAVLVAKRDAVQDIKTIVNQLKEQSRPEFQFHREVFRPWGSYDSIDNGERFQVKHITVKPGEKLSVQMHHHRAEHWIVVSGTAKVTLGEETLLISENESTYIPIGEVHALENPGKIELELIEVQSGSYLGEDDIVRLSDRYGRRKS